LASDIISGLSPVFLNLNTCVTLSPSFTEPKSCISFSKDIVVAVSGEVVGFCGSLALVAETEDDSPPVPGVDLGSVVDVTVSLVLSVSVDAPLLQAVKDSTETKASAFEAFERLKRFFMSKFDFWNEMK
jgi:hypothetical protein